MLFTNVVAMASAFMLAAAHPHTHAHLHADLETRQTPWRPCSHQTGGVHIIAVPGEGTLNPPYGLLDTLRASIMTALPGSTNISMPYNHSETNGLKQTSMATATLTQWLQQYKTSCPKTKIVLLGYSSGAITTLNSVCGAPPTPYNVITPILAASTFSDNVIATVVYGDETRRSDASYNLGTCTGVGIHPRATADCGDWASRIHSYCDADDPLCCVTTGTDQANHYKYPGAYDKLATQFVVDQFHALGGA